MVSVIVEYTCVFNLRKCLYESRELFILMENEYLIVLIYFGNQNRDLIRRLETDTLSASYWIIPEYSSLKYKDYKDYEIKFVFLISFIVVWLQVYTLYSKLTAAK